MFAVFSRARALGLVSLGLFGGVSGVANAAPASTESEVVLMIRDHRFDPPEIRIPAQQRVKLTVHNLDSTPEEFESHALNREKVIPARSSTVIYIGPLKAGRYPFVGEYHESTAKGVVVVE